MSRDSENLKRPSDYDDGNDSRVAAQKVESPELGIVGWLRWFWRQLTSMRVALVLLLLLAVAAIPGSLVPQRSADPNGVLQYQQQHPELFKFLDAFPIQAFDVYGSVWFSAIYLLLFISLIGCVLCPASCTTGARSAGVRRRPRPGCSAWRASPRSASRTPKPPPRSATTSRSARSRKPQAS